MSEIRDHIEEWIQRCSEIRPELGNFSICPFASKATFHVIETKIDDIRPIDGYDVVFFVVESHLDLNDLQNWSKKYNEMHSEWAFFEDCPESNTFIKGIATSNGKYNIIAMQNRQKLRQLRNILANTDYYKHWGDEFLHKILGDDYESVKEKIKTPDF